MREDSKDSNIGTIHVFTVCQLLNVGINALVICFHATCSCIVMQKLINRLKNQGTLNAKRSKKKGSLTSDHDAITHLIGSHGGFPCKS